MKKGTSRTAGIKKDKIFSAMQFLKYSINKWENQNDKLSKAKKKFCSRYNISVPFFGDYDCGDLFASPEGDEKVLPMPLLEGDEEKYYSVPSTELTKGVKDGKGVKTLTSNKLLTKLTKVLSKIKPGSKSQ